MCGEVVVT